MEIKDVQDAIREIKQYEQNALRARMGQLHTKYYCFKHKDERPVIVGYWYDEPTDLVVASVTITLHDEIFIACYPKDLGIEDGRNLHASEFMAGQLDYVTSNIC